MERNTENLERDEEANGINRSDGDHEVDDWNEKQIGFLARAILSRVTARKETTGAAIKRSGGQHAQPSGEDARKTASNRKRGGGGAVSVVTVLADLPIMPQQPPVTQTKGITTKYRAVTRSANR